MQMKNIVVCCALLSAAAAPVFAQSGVSNRAGEQHNALLTCLLDNGAPPADKALGVLMDACGYSAGMPRDEFIKTYQPAVDADYAVPLAKLMADQREAYGEYAFSFFERMDRVLADSTSWNEVDAGFADLQQEAYGRLPMEGKARAVILQSLDVGRSSAMFWQKVEGRLKQGIGSRRGWFRRLMAVVGADLKSYVSSFDVGTAGAASAVAGVNQIGEASGWW